MSEVRRWVVRGKDKDGAGEPFVAEVVLACDFDALRAENERLEREAKNDATAYIAAVAKQEELRAELSISRARADVAVADAHEAERELAALKAVPDGVEVVAYLNTSTGAVVKYGPTLMDWDDEHEPVEALMTVAQHSAIVATLRQPVAGEREAFEVEIPEISATFDGLYLIPMVPLKAGEHLMTIAQHLRIKKQLRAALSAPAAGQDVSALVEALESAQMAIMGYTHQNSVTLAALLKIKAALAAHKAGEVKP